MGLEEGLTALRDGVRNKILILDVERICGLSQQGWWDRGDLKARYIHYESVIREPRTTIVCAKWHDRADIIQLACMGQRRSKAILAQRPRRDPKADIIVGHNAFKADLPCSSATFGSRARIADRGPFEALPDLPPFKVVDTLAQVSATCYKTGLPFKGLDAALLAVGNSSVIPGKADRYYSQAMERAVAGSAEDRERLIAYCSGDVIGGQWLCGARTAHDEEPPSAVCSRKRPAHSLQPVRARHRARATSIHRQRAELRKCAGRTSCQGYSRISIEPERMSIVKGV
jgi:hypothetical protein